MAKVAQLRGIDNVMRNLNKELLKIKARSLGGLIEAAAIVRRDMDITPPLIPVDTGNLRGSWFATTGYQSKNPFVVMGFSAEYALFVHEIPKRSYSRPNSGAKFFEASLMRNKGKMLDAIARRARIK